MSRRLLPALALCLAACQTTPAANSETASSTTAAKPATATAASTAMMPMPPGLDETALDSSASPCDDFVEYACGGWLKSTEIPGDRGRWSRGFETIDLHNLENMRKLLAETADGKNQDAPAAKLLGDFYASCSDEAALEGSLPTLEARLKTYATVANAKALPAVLGKIQAFGLSSPLNVGQTQDYKDASKVIGEIDQGGLGLPDRDYYLKDDEKMKTVRTAYRAHAETMFTLMGEPAAKAKADADAVLSLETEIAKVSMSRVDRREPENRYHPVDRQGLKKLAPGFDWDGYLKAAGLGSVNAYNITTPAIMKAVATLSKSVPPAHWSAYLRWRIVSALVEALPKKLQDEDFAFSSKHLTGAKEDRPRWKKCVQSSSDNLGDAVGAQFVAHYFAGDSKAKAKELIGDVEGAFEANLDSLSWMDAPTRAKALEKVRKIANKIGYPDRWKDYSSISTSRTSYLDNLIATSKFEQDRQIAKIGKPVDRNEWLMTASEVNAYYSAPTNEIVFPAGILQPPFYDAHASPAVNFGGIGLVMGHEFTHGFDDEGRKYDADGNLRDWWTDASGAAFSKKTDCVKKQYSDYTIIDDIKINGALTLGENTADLGGMKLSHAAMVKYLAEHPQTEQYRYTPDQQFFLGFAQAWCTKARPEFRRVRAVTDPHSPEPLRVVGTIQDSPVFQQAFSCPAKAKMVRPETERCEVW